MAVLVGDTWYPGLTKTYQAISKSLLVQGLKIVMGGHRHLELFRRLVEKRQHPNKMAQTAARVVGGDRYQR
jgi:precorrin-6B methylase 1